MSKLLIYLFLVLITTSCKEQKQEVIDFGNFYVSTETFEKTSKRDSLAFAIVNESIPFEYNRDYRVELNCITGDTVDFMYKKANGDSSHFKFVDEGFGSTYNVVDYENELYLITYHFQSGGFHLVRFDKNRNEIFKKTYNTIVPQKELWRNSSVKNVTTYRDLLIIRTEEMCGKANMIVRMPD